MKKEHIRIGKKAIVFTHILIILLLWPVCSFAGDYSGGDGSAENPYRIATPNDLNDIGNHPEDFNDCFILVNDINLAGYTYTTALIAPDLDNANYDFDGTPFTGIFDGNGHVISSLIIDADGTSNDYLGLFGKNVSGEIINLGIEDCTIFGGWPLGGLCGCNQYGTISNCYVTGSVTGSGCIGGLCGIHYGRISNCFTMVSVTGHTSIGGLCGFNEGIISNCSSYGTISGEGKNPGAIGGLTGQSFNARISNCYANSFVIGGDKSDNLGGLCGENWGCTISNCYATGSVTGVDDSDCLGGLCGMNVDCLISNCYAAGSVSGDDWIGGLCGANDGTINNCYFLESSGPDNGYGTPLTDGQMKQQSSFAGWDFVSETDNGTEEIWTIKEGLKYPEHVWPMVQFVDWDGVDFRDYSFFAGQWLDTCCAEREGLVAHFKLDSDANDSSGNDYHGTLYGDPQFKPQDGRVNGALEFIGSDYVDITGYNGITGTDARTVTAWIKTDTTGEIITWGTSSAGQKWIFRVQDSHGTAGAIRVEVGSGYIVGDTDVRDNQWHHVAAVLENDGSPNGDEVKLYVDGVLEDTSAISSRAINTAGGTSMKIGVFIGNDRYFQGLIDEVRVYDWALSAEEICPSADFNGDGNVDVNDLKIFCNYWLSGKETLKLPIAWWKFDEGEGDTAYDSASSNNGTFVGDPSWVNGKIGEYALEFDGDDYVDFGNNNIGGVFGYGVSGSGSPEFTVSGWIKPYTLSADASSHGTRNVVLARASDSHNDNFELGISPAGNLDLYIDENDDDEMKTYGGGEITIGSWHYFSMTFDWGTVDVYLDNNHYSGSFAGDSLDGAYGSPVTIGTTTHSDIYFNGCIDDVRVYNRVLSEEEIQSIYAAGAGE